MEAIRLRLRADVPLGIYLSGGIDSSAVAGMVVHLVKEEGARLGNDDSQILSRIKCFTVQFDKDSGVDESGRKTLPLYATALMTEVHQISPNVPRSGSASIFTLSR
jgi:asparagine synthetase B (glutamine-hydrolysing)